MEAAALAFSHGGRQAKRLLFLVAKPESEPGSGFSEARGETRGAGSSLKKFSEHFLGRDSFRFLAAWPP